MHGLAITKLEITIELSLAWNHVQQMFETITADS